MGKPTTDDSESTTETEAESEVEVEEETQVPNTPPEIEVKEDDTKAQKAAYACCNIDFRDSKLFSKVFPKFV